MVVILMETKRYVGLRHLDRHTVSMFKVKWQNQYVADFNVIRFVCQDSDGLIAKNSTNCKGSGAIILENGTIHNLEFEKWASTKVEKKRLPALYKDIKIEAYDQEGKLASTYKLYGSWVSEFQALPDLDAKASAVVIEQIKIENEGWERDTSTTRPDKQ
jgi:phage tail-like protein